MRAVVQRVRSAKVVVEGSGDPVVTGSIGAGLVVLLGVRRGDGERQIAYLGNKILRLRIFRDERLAMNCSLAENGGDILLVSQFTLYGDCRKGRRPSFDQAEAPEQAEPLYRRFADFLTAAGHPPQQGIFGASMVVSLDNDGPVTLLLDSEKEF